MSHQIEDPSLSMGQDEPLGRSGPQEIEIAYLLQNSQPGDQYLVDILVDFYAEDVLRLIQAIQYRHFERTPSFAEVRPLVVRSFVDAVNHCDQFWGEASVRKWLYTLAVNAARAHNQRSSIQFPASNESVDAEKLSGIDDLHSKTEHIPPGLKDIPESHFLALVLHVVLGLAIEDAAEVLGEKTNTVHEWLINLRGKLINEQFDRKKQADVESHLGGDHQINRSRIQARIDGLMEQNSKEAILLREHLSLCEDCKIYSDILDRSWDRLKSNLCEQLPLKSISEEYLEQLKQFVLDRLTRSSRSNRLIIPLRKTTWLTLLLILFVSGAWALIRITPDIGEFPPTATPTTRYLPTPLSPGILSTANDEAYGEPFLAAYALEPKLSADGRWIVFTSNAGKSGGGDINDWLDILLYDAQSRTLESIGSQVMPIMQGIFTSPDISADGRWIVFNGVAGPVEDGDQPCDSLLFDPCTDILLYDRISSRLQRLTHGYEGGQANGQSVSPSISNNGRWITFWSAASNLVDDAVEPCSSNGPNTYCADLYVYDRASGDIEKVSIGRSVSLEQEFAGNIPSVDISDDGQLLLISIQEADRIAKQVGLQDENDLFIFNREGGEFTLVDIASDGTIGNGISYYGQTTPDGRYIVFNSTSDNLVPEDENGFVDIFLLDRNTGDVELISKSPDGTQADGESGINLGIWGEISISDDGRFVVYGSTATNLDPGTPASCSGDVTPCVFVYIHDSSTGETQRIETRGENHLSLMADISGDGRSISYADIETSCVNENELCIDLLIYDRERSWTSEITRNLFPREERSWEMDRLIETSSENVSEVEFSPDGRSIALAGTGSHVEILSIPDGELIRTLQGRTSGSIHVVAFSADGLLIAGGASDGTVNIWRSSDGSLAFLLKNHPGRIIDLYFSNAGDYLFVATPKAMWGWQIDERKFTRAYVLDYTDITVRDVEVLPSLDIVAVVPANEPFVWLQQLSSGDVIHRLGGYGRNLSSIAFSVDGNFLISQFSDGLVQLWELHADGLGSISPELIKEIILPGPLGKLTIFSDGMHAAVGSSYGGVWIWDFHNGRRQQVPYSENTIYIDDIDISSTGSMLAAPTRKGVYLWRNRYYTEEVGFFRQISTDEFIQVPNRRRPLQNALTSLRIDDIEVNGLLLYQADDQSAIDVFAATKLPTNVFYHTSSILDGGSVLSQYRVDETSTGLPAGDLFLLQQQSYGTFRPFWVGASGIIEHVEFNDQLAEYVKGDWLSFSTLESDRASTKNSEGLYWAWSSESDVQQLRWRNSYWLFSLIYIPRQNLEMSDNQVSSELSNGNISLPNLTKYDLIEIASGIADLKAASHPEQILINYTIEPGDTCSSIADLYGVSVDQLIQINNLPDNCDVIYSGQKLQVPLPSKYIPLAEADLDCDGRLEYLKNTPVFLDSTLSYGLILDSLSEIGLIETVWQYTVADVDTAYIIRPQLFLVDDCRQLLAVNLMPLDAMNGPTLQVFGWDGESMETVFTADGWFQSVTSPEGGEVTLTMLKLEYLPETSTCNRINVIYAWDGVGFNETESFTEENSSCGIE